MNANISVSPRLGELLSQVTEAPNLEAALWQVLAEYLDIKASGLRARIRQYESDWGMTFAEFTDRVKADQLGRDSYAYDVENAYWDWEEVETLLQHYQGLRDRWT
jgi:hypothetical protein